ncbi:MAG TPA: SDR family oxidoreductase, partial [Streptosporangiaceae bacterium]|nr:SDR family oxidoreductase [Streptosporangiaceae bacterium]
EALCLVQAKFLALAEDHVELLTTGDETLRGRIRLVEGDITRPGLGVGPARPTDVTEVWHLAAVYDLAVKRDLAMRVNLDGTRNVLDAARRYPDLRRFHYFSTCYVSGRYAGPFGEDDLDVGAPFNNHYEETKHLAEVEVRRQMADGLPATIYRPSIVVGDSRTGETQKFDGPYFILQWMLRQPRFAVVPIAGDPTMTRVNVVPRDFIVEAVTHLSGLPQSAGRTYHLADPHPLTVAQMAQTLADAADRRMIMVPVPRTVAKEAIRHVPGAHTVLRIPAEAVDYFAHPTHYLTENTRRDLAGSGIEVPRFPGYVDRLVDFMRHHQEVGSAAMV